MKRVVFVDDEQNVLSGLKRMLRSMRHEWDMQFFDNGIEALKSIEDKGCDVIVSDMRMPRMDGVQLLNSIREKYPRSIRIALSGQSDANMIYRCINNAHQYLAKPCDSDQLIATINGACALQDKLDDDKLKSVISNLESIPTLPESYEKIMAELQSDDPSLEAVGAIIETDIAMTAKILQIVNSAFFGLPRHVSSPAEAAMYLGIDSIKSLVVANGTFSQFDDQTVESAGLKGLSDRSLIIGTLAQKIIVDQTQDKIMADYALMAGVLADIGTLVLATEFPDDMKTVRELCDTSGLSEWDAERQVFDYSHMDVGAYLIALWGLPTPIVEAAAYHHSPADCDSEQFSPLTAVHIANALVTSNGVTENANVDRKYLQRIGLEDQLPQWVSLYQSHLSVEENNSDG